LDRVVGYLEGGMFEWAKAGLPAEHVPLLSAEDLNKRISSGPKIALIDVRAKMEFEKGHIDGAIHVPAPDLRKRYQVLDSSVPVVVVCNTGHRSSLAASLLKQKGFKEVYNMAGGMMGYNAAGYGPACAMCVAPHVPRHTSV
jgi:rhodanese-related sulfurtransferase